MDTRVPRTPSGRSTRPRLSLRGLRSLSASAWRSVRRDPRFQDVCTILVLSVAAVCGLLLLAA